MRCLVSSVSVCQLEVIKASAQEVSPCLGRLHGSGMTRSPLLGFCCIWARLQELLSARPFLQRTDTMSLDIIRPKDVPRGQARLCRFEFFGCWEILVERHLNARPCLTLSLKIRLHPRSALLDCVPAFWIVIAVRHSMTQRRIPDILALQVMFPKDYDKSLITEAMGIVVQTEEHEQSPAPDSSLPRSR